LSIQTFFLIISVLGYEKQKRAININSLIDTTPNLFIVKPFAYSLDEVMVTADNDVHKVMANKDVFIPG
jgi:hypothetical protein